MESYADDAVSAAQRSRDRGKARIRERFAQRMASPGYSARFEPTKIVVSKSGDMA
jgi:ketosteroid isomerase-like protein